MTSVETDGRAAKQATTSQTSSSTIWSNAVRWIESNGGYVHPQLRYNESLRQVYLVHHNSNTTASLSPSSSASLTNGDSSMTIDAGVTLLRIPDACLVSLHSVEKDEQFGKSLFAIVSNSSSTSTQSGSGSGYPSQKKKTKSLYHNDQDVVLALFLAHLQQLRQKQSISFYNPYLDTLPSFLHGASDNNNNDESNVDNKKEEEEESSSQHQLLPRQWSLETLKRRLHGTSLYQRIINERNGVRDEYELIKTAWMQQQQQQTEQASAPTTSFPTLEQYDTMMGAVTSRGFEGLGYDGVDVMIPLLDLLNHVRGSNSDVARVRYERYNMDECNEKKKDGIVEVADGDEGEKVSPPTKRIKTSLNSGEGGGVKVTAAQRISSPIKATIPLQMTYGAKSNSTLLGRYGFCIENNVEPDGSCNDVMEIQLQTGSPPVKLQRGPKSYTYGCLIKALQLFGDDGQSLPCGDGGDGSEEERLQQESDNDDADREGVVAEGDDDGGLQAFLDDCEEEDYGLGECDEEEEEDNDLDDMMYGHTSIDNVLPPSSSSSNAAAEMRKKDELQALGALHSSLNHALERCEKNSLICNSNGRSSCSGDKCISSSSPSSYDDYCIIWVKSEIRTISFYMKAVEMIQSKLLMGVGDANYVKRGYGMIDCLDHEHINDLVDAFMTIRHRGLSSSSSNPMM